MDQTTDYARRVVSGEIVSGEFARLAAKRHLDDLEHGHERGLRWVPEDAERFFRWCESVLAVTEGAKEGHPFKPLPWHIFATGSLFGWKNKNGHLRFRQNWWETGKGQAKSPMMAAIGIYLLGFYNLKRPEVYMIGEVKDTARVMFKDACGMVRGPIPNKGGERLLDRGFIIRGTGDNAYKIECPKTSGFMQPVANGDAISGPKPSAVLADEIHELKSAKGLNMWRASVAKKHGDSIMVLGTNTPSVDQHVGTEYSEKFQKILRGEFTDDSAFAYIARVDVGDNPFEDDTCWIKSLPALGITFLKENVQAEVNSAKQSISTSLTTKRLYFGIPVGVAGFWIDEAAWMKVQGEVDEEAMSGRKLHLALDLADKNDLTALSGCWEGDTLAVKSWYWTRETNIEDRSTADQIPYREIEAAGQITITPTPTIDFEFVAAQVQDLCSRHDVAQLVFDVTKIDDFIKACGKIGFDVWRYAGPDEPSGVGLKLVAHAQGPRVIFEGKQLCMPVSIRHFEDHILKGTVEIDRSRLTDICASNAVIVADAQKNKFYDKNKSRGRIDGLVTIAMAVGSATSEMEDRGPSVYTERGLLVM
jgi:phage terminase large subunit-like protein